MPLVTPLGVARGKTDATPDFDISGTPNMRLYREVALVGAPHLADHILVRVFMKRGGASAAPNGAGGGRIMR